MTTKKKVVLTVLFLVLVVALCYVIHINTRSITSSYDTLNMLIEHNDPYAIYVQQNIIRLYIMISTNILSGICFLILIFSLWRPKKQ